MKPGEYARREFNGEWFLHVLTNKYVKSMLLDGSGRAIAWDEDGNEMIIDVRDLLPDDRPLDRKVTSDNTCGKTVESGLVFFGENPRENNEGNSKVEEVKMTYEEKAIKAMELIAEGKIEEAVDIFHVTELPRFRAFLHVENQIPARVHMDYSGVEDPNLREFLEKSHEKYMAR